MKWILYFCCLAPFAQNVFAWGPQGHMIVAQIAEDQLSASAKKSVATLLPGLSLSQVANWADTIKSNPVWAKTKPWHYVDIPDGETYESITHAPEGDVITAITQMVNVLKTPSSTLEEKQNALKFIVHFVGDIHQPLHVGRPSDHGGNSIKIQFEGWNNSNLHQLWDSLMITKQNMDYLQYAHYLETQSYFDPSYEIPEIPFRQIITEDMGARTQIYDFAQNGDSPVVLGEAYMNQNLKTMNGRLLLGGKRLAQLLNSIFNR
jgi:hypothetical protein